MIIIFAKKIEKKKNLKKKKNPKNLFEKNKKKEKINDKKSKIILNKIEIKKNLNFIKKNLKNPLLITQRNIVKYNHTTSYGGFYANKSNVFNW